MKEPKVFSKLKSKKIINDKGKEVEIDVDRVKRLARWGFPYWPLEWRKKFEDKPIRQIYTEIEQSKRIFSEMDSFVSKQSKFEFQKYLIYKEFLFLQAVLFRYFPNEYIKIRFNTPKEYSPLLFSENPLINEIISDMKRFIIQAKKNVKNRERNISKIKENLLGDKLSERRKSQLGSLFTRWIIPVLYEYLRPFYKSTAHHHFSFLPSDRNRSNAYCPYELSKDISDILRYQYPEFKRKLTPRNVKSAVHRYIDLEDENHKNRIKNIYEPDDKYRVMLPRDIKKVLNSLETKKEVF